MEGVEDAVAFKVVDQRETAADAEAVPQLTAHSDGPNSGGVSSQCPPWPPCGGCMSVTKKDFPELDETIGSPGGGKGVVSRQGNAGHSATVGLDLESSTDQP
mmetsp:Transcript_3242/g.9415  ORF Transcript_3242/g.9415 Transcript_3242/m.9415 type:complete len:102 (-) Transcript_3242:2846-3151(-)